MQYAQCRLNRRQARGRHTASYWASCWACLIRPSVHYSRAAYVNAPVLIALPGARSTMTALLKTIGGCQTSYPAGYPTLRRRGACRSPALVGRRR